MYNILIGSVEQVIETIEHWREYYGISYIVIAGEERIESFASVIAPWQASKSDIKERYFPGAIFLDRRIHAYRLTSQSI